MAHNPQTKVSYLLENAVRQSGRRSSVQFSAQFARAPEATTEPPQLAQLFSLGEVPLRLYLTLVMMTAKPAEDGGARPLYRETPPSHLAETLGYEDLEEGARPPGSGTRRVKRALAALQREGFIELTKVAGHFPSIAVVHAEGSSSERPYITLPIEFWKNTWITVLSARATAVYVALRLVTAGKKQGEGQHVPPYERDRFHLKPDTWQRGTSELRRLGLLETRSGIVDTCGLRSYRRNVYFLNYNRVLEDRPPGAA